jgi:4-carboxymuconolactone decarboxylase
LILTEALNAKVAAKTLDEIILQSHLFLGFPAMIEASRIFADVRRPHHNTHQLPQAYSAATCREWNRNGLNKIRRIYGPAFDRLVPYINSFSPQILIWMVNDGYGQVLSRPGASFRLRETSVVATLTVTGYLNQLGAHIRGALNVGTPVEFLSWTMGNCEHFCPKSSVARARAILKKAVG